MTKNMNTFTKKKVASIATKWITFTLVLIMSAVAPLCVKGQELIYSENFNNQDCSECDETPVAPLPEYFGASNSETTWKVVNDLSSQTAHCYPRGGNSALDWEVYVAGSNPDNCGTFEGGYYKYRDGMSSGMSVTVGEILLDEGVDIENPENVSNVRVEYGLRTDIDEGDELTVSLSSGNEDEQIFNEGDDSIDQTEHSLEINPNSAYVTLLFSFESNDPIGNGSETEGAYVDDVNIYVEESEPPVVENPIPDQDMIQGGG